MQFRLVASAMNVRAEAMEPPVPQQAPAETCMTAQTRLSRWGRGLARGALIATALAACSPKAATTETTEYAVLDATNDVEVGVDAPADATAADVFDVSGVHPRLMFTKEHKAIIVARQNKPPFDAMWQRLRDQAAATPAAPTPGTWDSGLWSQYAFAAQANAILAWALDDAAAGAKAKQLLLALQDNLEDNDDLDLDIHIPGVLLPYANAWDLLQATPWITADEAKQAQKQLASVTRKFVAKNLDDSFMRMVSFIFTQNNHPLRAASSIGYIALAFPDDPDATRWLDWATDQMDYLLGPKGHYVQSDGGVVEGPFYFSFGFGAVVPFLLALDRNSPADAVHHHTCITRNDVDPWDDNGCVEGEAFTLKNPLRDPTFLSTLDWSIALRRPSGVRAVLNDTHVAVTNGAALLTSLGGANYLLWDWATNAVLPYDTQKFQDLTAWYLGLVADVTPAPPPWRNRFFPAAGHATFRSGWGTDDLWLMLVADHGPARKSLHNHADGASFALSAYGEDLLIDTGYYKPDSMQNPLTTDSPSHNVILVDGVGAPKRGLLNTWGDTDAFLENTHDGEMVAWAEGRIAYEKAEIRRGIAFARKRYFVVADRIQSEVATPRTFQWRAHLWAGFDVGGTYTLAGNRLTIDRQHGGLLIAATTTAGDPTFVEPPFKPLKPPHVHDTDGSGNHAVADATISAVAPGFLVVLAPFKEGATEDDGPLTVTAVTAGAASGAWTIDGVTAGTKWRDVAWLRDANAGSTLTLADGHTLETDAAFVLVAESGAYALIAGGTHLTLDGKSLIANNAAPVAVFGP